MSSVTSGSSINRLGRFAKTSHLLYIAAIVLTVAMISIASAFLGWSLAEISDRLLFGAICLSGAIALFLVGAGIIQFTKRAVAEVNRCCWQVQEKVAHHFDVKRERIRKQLEKERNDRLRRLKEEHDGQRLRAKTSGVEVVGIDEWHTLFPEACRECHCIEQSEQIGFYDGPFNTRGTWRKTFCTTCGELLRRIEPEKCASCGAFDSLSLPVERSEDYWEMGPYQGGLYHVQKTSRWREVTCRCCQEVFRQPLFRP
jgi:hypothetical protein